MINTLIIIRNVMQHQCRITVRTMCRQCLLAMSLCSSNSMITHLCIAAYHRQVMLCKMTILVLHYSHYYLTVYVYVMIDGYVTVQNQSHDEKICALLIIISNVMQILVLMQCDSVFAMIAVIP